MLIFGIQTSATGVAIRYCKDPQCRKPFTPTIGCQRYCSVKCQGRMTSLRYRISKGTDGGRTLTCAFCLERFFTKQRGRKTFCSPECQYQNKLVKSHFRAQSRKCKNETCGQRFMPASTGHLFCTNECRKRRRNREYCDRRRNGAVMKGTATGKCVVCEAAFEMDSHRMRQKYCSTKCQNQAVHKRRQERRRKAEQHAERLSNTRVSDRERKRASGGKVALQQSVPSRDSDAETISTPA